MKPITLIIPAAGNSTRLKTEEPKPFYSVEGQTLLEISCLAFQGFQIDRCIIPTSEAYIEKARKITKKMPFPCHCIRGGNTRAESVKNAVDLCDEKGYILIHDAARPLVSNALIQRVLDALDMHESVIPGIPVQDTIKQVSGHTVEKTLNRDILRQIQTPQGFHGPLLKKAYQQHNIGQFTDESSLVEAMGAYPYVVEGERVNIKITYPNDLTILNYYLNHALQNN